MTRTLVASAALLCLAAGPPSADDGEAAKERLRILLRDIIARQKQVRDGVSDITRHRVPPVLPREPALGMVPAVALRRSDKVVVSHTVRWNRFEKDELAVKVEASDPTITVPSELKLDFEKNQFRFDYEVKAGEKVGAFVVTLTPEAGPPVVVKVIVK